MDREAEAADSGVGLVPRDHRRNVFDVDSLAITRKTATSTGGPNRHRPRTSSRNSESGVHQRRLRADILAPSERASTVGQSAHNDADSGGGEEGDLRHSPIVVLCGAGRFLAGRRSRVLHVAEWHLGPLWRTLSAGDIEAGVPGRIGAWTASWGMSVRRYPKVGCCC